MNASRYELQKLTKTIYEYVNHNELNLLMDCDSHIMLEYLSDHCSVSSSTYSQAFNTVTDCICSILEKIKNFIEPVLQHSINKLKEASINDIYDYEEYREKQKQKQFFSCHSYGFNYYINNRNNMYKPVKTEFPKKYEKYVKKYKKIYDDINAVLNSQSRLKTLELSTEPLDVGIVYELVHKLEAPTSSDTHGIKKKNDILFNTYYSLDFDCLNIACICDSTSSKEIFDYFSSENNSLKFSFLSDFKFKNGDLRFSINAKIFEGELQFGEIISLDHQYCIFQKSQFKILSFSASKDKYILYTSMGNPNSTLDFMQTD
eukprot:gene11281-4093_t